MTDPHETRMRAGQHAALTLEALDDETLALFPAAVESLAAIANQLRDRGLQPTAVLNVLIGMVVAEALSEQQG